MSEEIDVQVAVYAPDGWHNLENEAGGYWLHSDSLATRSTPRRNVMFDGDWVDGSAALHSTRGNVVETLAIYCSGATAAEFRARWEAMKSWFDQLRYKVTVTIDGVLAETWICLQPGEYTEDLNQAYRFATMGLLRVQVAHLPYTGA